MPHCSSTEINKSRRVFSKKYGTQQIQDTNDKTNMIHVNIFILPQITQNSGNQTYLLVRYFTENLKVNANGDMIEELINTLVYPLEDNASYKVQVCMCIILCSM